MKKYFRKLLVAIGFSTITMSAQAGVPVIDVAAILNLVMTYSQDYLALTNDYNAYYRQYEQLVTAGDQLKAMKDSRGMGALINNDAFRQALPKLEFIDFRSLDGSKNKTEITKQMIEAAKKRITMLSQLSNSIDNPDNDAKASTDLNNRIAVENARLQNEQMAAYASKEFQESKAREEYYKNREDGSKVLKGSRGLKLD